MQSICNPSKYGIEGTDKNRITAQGQINGDVAGNNDGITNSDALTSRNIASDRSKSFPKNNADTTSIIKAERHD